MDSQVPRWERGELPGNLTKRNRGHGAGIRWYRVSKGLVGLYILEEVEIWSGDTDPSHTDNRIYRATQLV